MRLAEIASVPNKIYILSTLVYIFLLIFHYVIHYYYKKVELLVNLLPHFHIAHLIFHNKLISQCILWETNLCLLCC